MNDAHPRHRASDLLRQLGSEIIALADQLETENDPAGPRWISLKAAGKIALRTEETMRTWAVKFRMGHKTPGGRSAPWVIDEIKLRQHLARMPRQNS